MNNNHDHDKEVKEIAIVFGCASIFFILAIIVLIVILIKLL